MLYVNTVSPVISARDPLDGGHIGFAEAWKQADSSNRSHPVRWLAITLPTTAFYHEAGSLLEGERRCVLLADCQGYPRKVTQDLLTLKSQPFAAKGFA